MGVPKRWVYIRIAIVLAGFVSGFFMPLTPAAEPPIGWDGLFLILLAASLGLQFVIGIQVINPRSAKIWHKPNWKTNPFNFFQPLQFFHLIAYKFIALGIVVLVRLALSTTPFFAEALVPLAMGVGALAGIQLSVLLFKRKFQVDT